MVVKHIESEEDFKRLKESGKLIIIDFWATWCGPCRMLGPIFDETSKDYEGKIEFVKIDVDEVSEVASDYNVMSIPTLFIIKGDEILDQRMGALTKAQLKSFIDSHL